MDRSRSEVEVENKELIQFINESMQKVLDEAPSDASVKLSIKQVGEGFKGILKVSSAQRRFVSAAGMTNLALLVKNLFEQTHHSIGVWKRLRLFDGTTECLKSSS